MAGVSSPLSAPAKSKGGGQREELHPLIISATCLQQRHLDAASEKIAARHFLPLRCPWLSSPRCNIETRLGTISLGGGEANSGVGDISGKTCGKGSCESTFVTIQRGGSFNFSPPISPTSIYICPPDVLLPASRTALDLSHIERAWQGADS